MEREHISRFYAAELNDIRAKLLEMGGKVELMINNAMKSLIERDSDLAERIVAFDREINCMEVEIDEKCIQVLATRQPTARDLRFLTLALKIVTDLEQIGNQCTAVAGRALELNREPPLKPYIDLPRMANWASVMVKEALDAFVSGDAELALKVCNDDPFVDELNEQIQRVLLTYMMEDNDAVSRGIKITYISKCFERIGDHATNIAEMVIFMVKGRDIRHTGPLLDKQTA